MGILTLLLIPTKTNTNEQKTHNNLVVDYRLKFKMQGGLPYTKSLCRSISRNMIAHMDTCVGFRSSAEHLGFGDKARHTPQNPSESLNTHPKSLLALAMH